MNEYLLTVLKHEEFKEGEHWKRISVTAGTDIIRQGDAGRTFYLIESGRLRVLGHVGLGDDKHVNHGVCDLNPGEVVGELGLFDSEPRCATVQAIEDCTLIEIDGDKLISFLNEHTDMGFKLLRSLMGVMVGRIRKSNEKVFSLLAWGLKAYQIEKDL